jgi:hypothetical protein
MGKRVGTYVLPFFGLGSGGDHQGGAPREAAMAGGIREASCVSVTQRNEMGCWGLREGAPDAQVLTHRHAGISGSMRWQCHTPRDSGQWRRRLTSGPDRILKFKSEVKCTRI